MGTRQANPSAVDLPDVHPRRGALVWRQQVPNVLLQVYFACLYMLRKED